MKIHTPKFIFNTATDFFNVGKERCEKIFVGDYLNDPSIYLKITAPATILAFSMELILKSILLFRNNVYPRTHRLSDLYNRLSQIDQDVIEKYFSEIVLDFKVFPTFRYAIESKENEIENDLSYTSAKQEIMSELKTHDISFVKWRYVFSFPEKEDEEKLQYNFAFIVKLFQASFKHSKIFI